MFGLVPAVLGRKGGRVSSLLTNLSSYWKLEEAAGNRNDSVVASANDLTAVAVPGNAAGIQGNAVSLLKASAQYLSHVDAASLRNGAGSWTMAFWVKLTDKTSLQAVVGKWATANNFERLAYYDNVADRFVATVSVLGSDIFTVTANTFGIPAAATWYFICLWWDGANIRISVNDGGADLLAVAGPLFAGGTSPLYLGENSAGQELNGLIDEVGWWKGVALSAAQRTGLYNGGVGVTYPFTGVP